MKKNDSSRRDNNRGDDVRIDLRKRDLNKRGGDAIRSNDRGNMNRQGGNRQIGDRQGGDRRDNNRRDNDRRDNNRRDNNRRDNDRRGNDRRGNDKRPNQAFKKRGTHSKGVSQKQLIQPHPRFPGVFITRGKEDLVCTLNLTPGQSVYNEKRITTPEKIEYRVWNPYRSKLSAGITAGLDNIHIRPGSTVLYLGAASGTSVSHVSDIIGKDSLVYAVEFSQRSGRDLISLAKKRSNIVPIIDDARHPQSYRMIVPMVDVIFSDVAQPDQARIVALNAQYFLKEKGGVVMSIKANCVDSTKHPSEVFAMEVDKLKREGIKPKEQVGLDPFEKDHAIVVGIYNPGGEESK